MAIRWNRQIVLLLWIITSVRGQTIHNDNLALFRPTGMVSQDADNKASRAVDGWRDFRVIRKSCAVTGTSTTGFVWWYVDLGKDYNIKRVIIANSAKSPGWEKQKNFNIYVFDYFNGTNIWENKYSICNGQGPVSMKYGGVKQFDCLRKCVGRYVVILKVGKDQLQLCEVEVYDDSSIENVGLQKPTQLYTHYYGDHMKGYLFGFRGVDGHANVMLADKTCVRSSGNADVEKERWAVDLGRDYRVRRIVVVNRGDGNTGHLFRKFHLLVTKQYHPWEWEKNHFRECYQQRPALLESEMLEVNCNYNTVGRYVLFQTDEAASVPMFLCEAEVYATPVQENLALNRPSVMSGEIGKSVKTSGKAVDGLVYAPFGSGTCVKTKGTDSTEWLMVDLQGLFIIDHVLMFNRGDLGRCIKPMGMDARNPKIPDAQLSASTEQTNLNAKYGRMWQNRKGTDKYAWCATTADTNKYLQIDFGQSVIVNGVIVQGTKPVIFTRTMKVSYSEDGTNFKFIKDSEGNDIEFIATYAHFDNTKTTWFPQELILRKLRIHPVVYTKYPCLRVEVLGCWNSGTDLKNFKIQTAKKFDPNNYGSNTFTTCHKQVDRLPSASMNKLVCKTRPVARYVVVEKNPAISDPLTFCEVEVYGEKYDGNLAYRQPTQQSSQYEDWTSDRAVDGVLDPNVTRSQSCARTKTTSVGSNWFKVDLGKPHDIGWVDIISEADCCEYCLTDFEIVVTDTFDPSKPAGQNSSVCYSYDKSMPGGQLVSLKCMNETRGRYVVVVHPGNAPLIICELRVYAKGEFGFNYALGKMTDQSSLADPVDGHSRLAVDGVQIADYQEKSCTLTCGGMTDPWWMTDLGRELNIKKVVLTNRNDCCYYRLRLFKIIVSKNFIPFQLDQIESTLCAAQSSAVGPGVRHAVYCGRKTVGRYVIVTKSQSLNRPLTLCEVQVYGDDVRNNLALKKPSQLSSETGTKSASRINDGNSNPNYNAGSCSSTSTSLAEQWWTVDLQATYVIKEVFVANAVDCCSESMTDYRIMVSSTFTSDFTALPYYLCVDVIDRASRELDFFQHACIPGAKGRHVTFLKPNAMKKALVLCEVEVYGTEVPKTTLSIISMGKSAQQSSEGTGVPTANKAIDGRYSIHSSNCAKTQASYKSASWTVDLGNSFYIMSVDIYIPGNCCDYKRHRLALLASDTFTQSALNSAFPDVSTPAGGVTVDNGNIVVTNTPFRICAVHDSTPPKGQILHEICEHGTHGRYFSIVKKMTYNNHLYLCEVVIHGTLKVNGLPPPLSLKKRSIVQVPEEFQPIFSDTLNSPIYNDAPKF